MTSATNTARGNCHASAVRVMRSYDRLPLAVRDVLKTTVVDWFPVPWERDLKKGAALEAIIADIRRSDAGAAAAERRRVAKELAELPLLIKACARRGWKPRPKPDVKVTIVLPEPMPLLSRARRR